MYCPIYNGLFPTMLLKREWVCLLIAPYKKNFCPSIAPTQNGTWRRHWANKTRFLQIVAPELDSQSVYGTNQVL